MGAAGALLGLVAIQYLAGRGQPLGLVSDECLFLLLARNLSLGSFAVPVPGGTPVTDPLPGYPLLLAPASLLLGSWWPGYRLLQAAVSAAGIAAFYRLAAALVPRRTAAALAAGLFFSPAWLSAGGLCLPDLALAAGTLAAALALERRPAALLALTALLPLIKPHGLLVGAAAVLDRLWRGRRREAAALAACAAAPLLTWAARNRLAAGSATGYLDNWALQAPLAASDPAALAAGLARLLGWGAAGGGAWLGLGLLAAAAVGAGRLVREDRPRWAFTLCCSAGLTLCLHLSWAPASPRYAAFLLPPLALLAAGALPARAAGPLAAAWLAFGAARSLPALRAGASAAPRTSHPETFAWIAARLPADARVETPLAHPVTLLTGRASSVPVPLPGFRDAWLAQLLRGGVGYVVSFDDPLSSDGFLSAPMRSVLASYRAWTRSSPYLVLVYASEKENTRVLAVRHPDPPRYFQAWEAYRGAAALMREGRAGADAEALLRRAVSLEPQLACAWALWSALAPDRARKSERWRRAVELDPLAATEP